jgi:glycosyltransferase involved in cell wall biosynthesis
MNILFLLGDATSKGGIEKVTVTLTDALSVKYNAEIISLYKTNDVAIFEPKLSRVSYLNNYFENSMYNRQFSGFINWVFDFSYILKKGFKLHGVLKKDLDVIVTCDIKMTLIAWLACFFTTIKIISIEHFEYDVAHPVLKCLRKFLYKRISNVVTLTSEDKDKYSWLESEKLKVIPNIVCVNLIDKGLEKKKIVIAVGRFTHQKGFDLLIDAWSLIGESYPDWTLKIYGEGEDEVKLEALIKSHNLHNVKLCPYSASIDDAYQESKIFVLSSRYEGLGMVLLEALANKLPCISFDCPAGPKTIIQNDFNGILVPTGDVKKLASSLSLLMSDVKLQAKYSSNALESINIYRESSVVGKWSDLLEETKNGK